MILCIALVLAVVEPVVPVAEPAEPVAAVAPVAETDAPQPTPQVEDAEPIEQQPNAEVAAPDAVPVDAAAESVDAATVPVEDAADGVAADDPLPLVSEAELDAWRSAQEEKTDAASTSASAPETGVPKAWVARSEDASKRGRRAALRRKGPPEKSAAFVLGYRHFSTKDMVDRDQAWHVGSLEVAPIRRYVRLNLVTEFGFEGGEAAEKGEVPDFFVMEKAGLGVQYPHYVTPFVEFQGGAGLLRTEMFDRNDLGLVWSLGVDAGAQWSIARTIYVHAALGWIRPTFRRATEAVYFDRLTFKVGLGF